MLLQEKVADEFVIVGLVLFIFCWRFFCQKKLIFVQF